jgi:hypothetical protein
VVLNSSVSIAGAERGFQHDEGVAASGDVAFEVEGQGASDGAFAEAGDQRALPGVPIGTKLGEPALDLGESERAQVEGHGAGADRGQQFAGVFGEQKNGGELGWLFQNFEQRVGCLLHKGRTGEDVNALASFTGTIVDGLNHVANLVDLDHQLRRIGRDDEHVGVGLDEEAGLLLVSVTQIFASLDSFGEPGVEVRRLRDASAVRAVPAKIGQAVGQGMLDAVHGARQHQSQRVFARSVRPGKNDGVRKVVARQHLAQAMDGFRVAGKIGKGHGESLLAFSLLAVGL